MEVELARQAGEERPPAAIFAITQDRRAEGDAMCAQLMRTARDGDQREPGCAPGGVLDHTIERDGALALLIGVHPFAVAPALLGEGKVDAAFGWLGKPDDGRPVDLSGLLASE